MKSPPDGAGIIPAPLEPNIPTADGAIEPVPKIELDAVTVEVDGGGALDEAAPGSAPNPLKVDLLPPLKENGDGCCVLSPEATDPLGLKALTLVVLVDEERLPKVVLVEVGPPLKKDGIEGPVDVAVLVDGPNFISPAELALKAGRDTNLLSA